MNNKAQQAQNQNKKGTHTITFEIHCALSCQNVDTHELLLIEKCPTGKTIAIRGKFYH